MRYLRRLRGARERLRRRRQRRREVDALVDDVALRWLRQRRNFIREVESVGK